MSNSNHTLDEPDLLHSRTISDRRYELFRQRCNECSKPHFRVVRWAGASFSSYFPPEDFSPEDFDAFVETVDETLLMSASDMASEFLKALTEENTPQGIYSDWSFAFRLLEYGRHRLAALQKLGVLPAITHDSPPGIPTSRLCWPRSSLEWQPPSTES